MRRSTIAVAALAALTLIGAAAADAAGPALSVLYKFKGPPDGYNPNGDLLFDQFGDLYGTTQFGGKTDFGIVFQLHRPTVVGGVRTETALHSFQGGADGGFPDSGLSIGPNSSAYGTTPNGGDEGHGTVYALRGGAKSGATYDPNPVFDFPDVMKNGSYPVGVSADENCIYGSTLGGGQYANGTVYLLPDGAQRVLHDFCEEIIKPAGVCLDGNEPRLPTVASGGAILFGTTNIGGHSNVGVIYRIDRAGYGVVHEFCRLGACGAYPPGRLVVETRDIKASIYDVYGTTTQCASILQDHAIAGC